MGMTMTEKILAKHSGRDSVSPGDLLISQLDLILANDITGPPAIDEFAPDQNLARDQRRDESLEEMPDLVVGVARQIEQFGDFEAERYAGVGVDAAQN